MTGKICSPESLHISEELGTWFNQTLSSFSGSRGRNGGGHDDHGDPGFDDRLRSCWALQTCGSCLSSDVRCGWCPYVLLSPLLVSPYIISPFDDPSYILCRPYPMTQTPHSRSIVINLHPSTLGVRLTVALGPLGPPQPRTHLPYRTGTLRVADKVVRSREL